MRFYPSLQIVRLKRTNILRKFGTLCFGREIENIVQDYYKNLHFWFIIFNKTRHHFHPCLGHNGLPIFETHYRSTWRHLFEMRLDPNSFIPLENIVVSCLSNFIIVSALNSIDLYWVSSLVFPFALHWTIRNELLEPAWMNFRTHCFVPCFDHCF